MGSPEGVERTKRWVGGVGVGLGEERGGGGRAKFRVFFPLPLPCSFFFSLSLLVGFLEELWLRVAATDHPNCAFILLFVI